MAILDKLKQELDRAGRAAQDAFDEGKTRLEAFRERQLADKAAQALGYAVFRARESGSEVDAETLGRLTATLKTNDAEAVRLENELDKRRTDRKTQPPSATSTESGGDTYQGAPS
ncbi:MAG: hypothetical protein H0W69_07445 [Gemmatimonadaceae bacterium]|nr:hypothetical protein [Gemmatimonadaceae bacterium]